jgi:hypothetical protein
MRTLLYAAKDAEGRPVAVAGVALFGDLAYPFTLLSDPATRRPRRRATCGTPSSRSTSARRVRATWSSVRRSASAKATSTSSTLLGYRVRNLRLDVTPWPRGSCATRQPSGSLGTSK